MFEWIFSGWIVRLNRNKRFFIKISNGKTKWINKWIEFIWLTQIRIILKLIKFSLEEIQFLSILWTAVWNKQHWKCNQFQSWQFEYSFELNATVSVWENPFVIAGTSFKRLRVRIQTILCFKQNWNLQFGMRNFRNLQFWNEKF